MATIPCVRRKRRWTVKRSISAAVVVTLVLIAVTATISICLAPANISFQLRQAEIVSYRNETNPGSRTLGTHLNFTLVALNNSSRTEVRYGSVDAEIWYGPTDGDWIRTSAFVLVSATEATKWYPPGSNACFGASADYEYSFEKNAPQNSLVVVEAKVWFRYGLATTLPFTVRSSCWHVNFVNKTNVPIVCVPS